jgi:hypothetical protein
MRTKLLKSIMAGCVILSAGGWAYAQTQPDSTQLLLNLLVKKGIVTQSEATELSNQVQSQQAARPMPAPEAAPAGYAGTGPVAPSYGSARIPTSGPVTANVAVTPAPGTSPLYFSIGSTHFTPLGFLDFTTVYRTATNGGDIGSSFGGIPYSNTAAGQLSETRFSAKNSRLGMRVDSNVGESKVLGYLEADFLGNAATNINVASNSDVMRMRVYFVDVRNGGWEFLAGQDWSMLTPNRKGLSPLPSDVFYSQDVDTNYQVGLVWGRTPQIRAVYHPSDEWALGLSAENPDQYVGGATVLPSNLTATFVDNGSNGTATPNVIPDFIGKIAYDTKFGDLPFHADIAGLFREFKIDTFATGATPINATSSATGEGASYNMILNLTPSFALVENAFFSDGGGRYVSTGLAPDFIVTPPNASGVDSISPVHASSGIVGFEWDATALSKIYGYYGLARFGRDYANLTPSTYVGYGYPGSPTTNNRQIDEYTIGLAQVLWKGASYGDLKLLLQASYLERTPWYVAPGAPDNAHLTMFYADLRYDLP